MLVLSRFRFQCRRKNGDAFGTSRARNQRAAFFLDLYESEGGFKGVSSTSTFLDVINQRDSLRLDYP